MKPLFARLVMLAVMLVCGLCPVWGAGWKTLPGHVPAASKKLSPIGRLPATNELRLAIGLPLRDPAGLAKFLADVYDPASPNYRQFLTPEEFTARFGPTEADYAAVKNFARTNGLTVTGTHGNRLLLDVRGPVANVERAFHIHLRTFKHPTEAREFFAPDAEPTVDAGLPVVDVQGLSDFSRPQPKLRKMGAGGVAPKNGSAPDASSYIGNDFRNAYVPGTTLTGAGQSVGLFQLDGFYTNDIKAYAQTAGGGRTNIVIQTVLVDGYNGVPSTTGTGNGEVSLDIEMAMAMAPGLAKIVVFEATDAPGYVNDVLNMMVASNTIKNLSCSWCWSGVPTTTTETIFSNMMAQGQTFFNASGDKDAFTVGATSINGVDNETLKFEPASSPSITQVGGTTLTMNGNGTSYASETVWNLSDGDGSSGGISTNSIPVWQQGISMTANGGSTTNRNIPDVALTADNCYGIYGNGNSGSFSGTSAAAPLWAGFMALVNQQAALAGKPPVGFLNPAIYTIGKSANYTNCFHDITAGNNTWSGSLTSYYAVPGYDLCTGWGTPNGAGLINALAGSPVISPMTGSAASMGSGLFTSSSQIFSLTNSGSTNTLAWSMINTSVWLNVSPGSGTLATNASTNITVSLTTAGKNLAVGTYPATLVFTNAHTATTLAVPFQLQISSSPGLVAAGAVGGLFSPTTMTFVLTNSSPSNLVWSLVNTSLWINASTTNGTVTASNAASFSVGLSTIANSLSAGIYAANVLLTNRSTAAVLNIPFQLQVGQSFVQNGGFETGSSPWTLVDNGGPDKVDNNYYGITPHTGTYYFAFGQQLSLASLSQSIATIPGQGYLLSFWLTDTYYGNSPEQFIVNWNTNSTSTNTVWIWHTNNLPASGWTNYLFVVTATGTNTTLQFAAQNDSGFFGLDDVSVTPIPMPTFTGFSKKTNSLALTWNALAGVSYQVLYKTNLLQSAWLTNFTTIATTNLISFTNNPGSDPRRFYRVQRLP